jgi:hypothetical protein
MSARALEHALQEMVEREAIRDVLYRYAHGMDRMDGAYLRKAFWPDGFDDHGSFKGGTEAFIKWAFDLREAGMVDRLIHKISNILIDFYGDEAAVESYFTSYHRFKNESGEYFDEMLVGRYVDHMVNRNGEWRILKRVVVRDWVRRFADSKAWEDVADIAKITQGSTAPNDPIYKLHNLLKNKEMACQS